MASTLITAYVGEGLAANRPATPVLATGTIGYYYATDTGILTAYVNGAWQSVFGKQLLATSSPSGVSSVTFSSIPTGFKDLELRVHGRASDAVTSENLLLQFNGDTGNNYDYQQENRFGRGTGNGVSSIQGPVIVGSSGTANYPSDVVIEIFNYSGTTFYKGIRCYQEFIQSAADAGMFYNLIGGWWRNTAAINAIKIACATGNFVTGSLVSLYGIPG